MDVVTEIYYDNEKHIIYYLMYQCFYRFYRYSERNQDLYALFSMHQIQFKSNLTLSFV